MKRRNLNGIIFLFVLLAQLLGACASADELKVGDDAPVIDLPSASGQSVALDFKGEPVLLYFHMAMG